jgi:hypothetical protein
VAIEIFKVIGNVAEKVVSGLHTKVGNPTKIKA